MNWFDLLLVSVGFALAVIGVWNLGYDQGRTKGRSEVFGYWLADRGPKVDLPWLDEPHNTGGIVPPHITDRIPGHEDDQPKAGTS